jgi:hypothetical protein
MSSGRVVTSAVMFAIFAAMSVIALGLPDKARFLPLLIGVPGAAMALAQLVIDIRAGLAATASDTDPGAVATRAREAKMFLWLAFFVTGILAFGFVVAGPVLVAAYLRFAEREGWTTSLVAGAGAWVVLYAVFVRGLELFLFDGFVWEWLLG